MIQQGHQIWEIGTHFGRTVASIEKFMSGFLKGSSPQIKTPIKKYPLEKEELDWLIHQAKDGVTLTKLAIYLGRSRPHVSFKIKELAMQESANEPPVVHEPEDYSPELIESVVLNRLRFLFGGLLHLEMTETWRKLLTDKPADSWISAIAESIPTDLKRLLASKHPPTTAQLEALP
jgi:hypothetical protein